MDFITNFATKHQLYALGTFYHIAKYAGSEYWSIGVNGALPHLSQTAFSQLSPPCLLSYN